MHVFNITRSSDKSEKRFYHTFVVEGRGHFPYDMLRYDHCFPVDSGNDIHFDRSERGDGADTPRQVKLGTWQERKLWEPTTGRWGSFGWCIVPNHLQDR